VATWRVLSTPGQVAGGACVERDQLSLFFLPDAGDLSCFNCFNCFGMDEGVEVVEGGGSIIAVDASGVSTCETEEEEEQETRRRGAGERARDVDDGGGLSCWRAFYARSAKKMSRMLKWPVSGSREEAKQRGRHHTLTHVERCLCSPISWQKKE
jgi:hypothetical protein